MQIPLLIAGPAIPAGQTLEQRVSHLDIAPTLLDLCGLDSGRQFHGSSLTSLLGNDDSHWRKGLMGQHYGLQQPIVQRAWYRDNWKLVIRQDGYRELYDLAVDPGEMENLAADQRSQRQLESMEQELANAMRATADNETSIIATLPTPTNRNS